MRGIHVTTLQLFSSSWYLYQKNCASEIILPESQPKRSFDLLAPWQGESLLKRCSHKEHFCRRNLEISVGNRIGRETAVSASALEMKTMLLNRWFVWSVQWQTGLQVIFHPWDQNFFIYFFYVPAKCGTKPSFHLGKILKNWRFYLHSMPLFF